MLIGLFTDAGMPLDMTTTHADTRTLRANLESDQCAEHVAIFGRLTDRLLAGGAAMVAITSIAGHFCRHDFAQRSPLPVVDMIDAVSREVSVLIGMPRCRAASRHDNNARGRADRHRSISYSTKPPNSDAAGCLKFEKRPPRETDRRSVLRRRRMVRAVGLEPTRIATVD